MIAHHMTLFSWLLPMILTAPWIAGSVYFLRARPRDGFIPPSYAESASLRR